MSIDYGNSEIIETIDYGDSEVVKDKSNIVKKQTIPQKIIGGVKQLAKNEIDKTKGVIQQFAAGQKETEQALYPVLESLYGVKQVRNNELVSKEPQGILQSGARVAGKYLAPQPAFAGAPGEAVMASAQLGRAASAIYPSVASKLTPLTTKLTEHIAPLAKRGLTTVANILSSIKPEYYENALNKELAGESIFKGKWDPKIFNSLGNKAQSAINFIQKETGKATQLEQQALKGINKKIPISDIVENINKEIDLAKFGRINTLAKEDLKLINSVKNDIIKFSKKGEMTPAEMHGIAKNIQESVKYSTQKVNNVTSEGERVLKGIAKNLKDKIGDEIPSYKDINAKYSEIVNLKNELIPLLKNQNVSKNLKNILNKDDYTISLFEKLDSLAPNKLKFLEDTVNSITREPFERIFSGQGGGSGSSEGIANILRSYIGKENPEKIPFMSPKLQKYVIQGVGKVKDIPIAKTTPVLSKIGVGFIPQNEGSYSND